MNGTVQIIRGNALALPLADSSVDLVVTSPPYFGLRSYQDGGEHYDGQIGAEATPAEFVDALIAATAEMVRVLKPSGSIFVNLGDKYAGGGSGPQGKTGQRIGRSSADEPYKASRRARRHGIPDKSLIGIPWRYALRCIDDLGLILRAEIIWAKPNGLPESVTDRVRRSHETWFHFTVQPRYFSAVDEIREAYAPDSLRASKEGASAMKARNASIDGGATEYNRAGNPLGKLPGSVWSIPTQPLQVPDHLGIDHFAAFPMEWPRRIIQGWSPSEVCTACGDGRRPVSGHTPEWIAFRKENGMEGDYTEATVSGTQGLRTANRKVSNGAVAAFGPKHQITGYACACPGVSAPTRPSVVLDPFGGTGTTALMARALGRTGISVDMSSDYCCLAEWRTTDPGQMAAALQVEKPEVIHPDQLSLFGDVA
jgi:DNA modification methylase